jgi:hypothetical protein
MMRRGVLLSILLAPFFSKAEQKSTKQIITPSGPVSLNTREVPSTPQQVTPVGALTLKKIRELDAAAAQLLAAYRPGSTSQSLQAYDEAFSAWQRDKKRRLSETAVIARLGAYLGNRLVADFDMEWVEVTDEYGTDLAVRSRKFEVMAFPHSSVKKRIEDNEHDFMVGVYYAVQDAIASGPKTR